MPFPPSTPSCDSAAIDFALSLPDDRIKPFLQLWREKNWEQIKAQFITYRGPFPNDPPLSPREVPFLRIRMILCEICGNKRCPHATNVRFKCTHSNEPGQTGTLDDSATSNS